MLLPRIAGPQTTVQLETLSATERDSTKRLLPIPTSARAGIDVMPHNKVNN
jgi:hypothetical protein